MKVAAVTAEYNPFHNGHVRHLLETRQGGAEAVVAVMSGNFVQRGDFALCPKRVRAAQALKNGVDLVLELPLPWAVANAQTFAFGAVSIADALGFVNVLSFGCESGSLEPLKLAVSALREEKTFALIKKYLDSGEAFAAARERALSELFGLETARAVAEPNNTLAVEYLTALEKLKSCIEPFAVKRMGAWHDSSAFEGTISSASHIRQMILGSKNADSFLPESSAGLFESGEIIADPMLLDKAILSYLRRLSPDDILSVPDISEGLENRLYAAIRSSATLSEFFENAKTKRYTMARIRRIVLCLFLGIKKEDSQGKPPYARILGFNQKGKELLTLARGSSIPLVSSKAEIEVLGDRAKRIFELENLSSDLYALALGKPCECGFELKEKMLVIQ